VLIYTGDNTMVEAYYRTNIDALGIYAHLGADYVVPDPDPSWPADSLVLIDARTHEVLEATALADVRDAGPHGAPVISLFGEPYPDGVGSPLLTDLIPGGAGGTLISASDTEYVFGLLRYPSGEMNGGAQPTLVPIPFPKGDVLVLAAIDWQCAWITEYVWATEANDPERAATAAAQVEKFPDLEVIQKYNPEFGESVRDSLTPRIIGGDIEYAKRWLNTSCSGMNN
jgi:hypothetical protein